MKKWLLSVLFLAKMTAYAKTPEQFFNQAYPRYIHTLECRLATLEDNHYCMRIAKEEVRETPQGKLKFVLLTGNYFDLPNLKEEYVHVASGLAGLFVFRELAGKNNWDLLASAPFKHVGSYGQAPEAKHWTFHEFGKDKWGFLTEHSDVHQGFAGSHYVILSHNGDKKMTESWLGSSIDNTGAYGENCEYMMIDNKNISKKEHQQCLAKLHQINRNIKILRQEKPINGFYPLEISLSGLQGRTKFNNQRYIIKFDAKKQAFVAPKNYLLREIDY